MDNEINLLKNNDKRTDSDLEWITEFYDFLKGGCPENISFARGHGVKLSPNKAYSIIYYLQEHFPVLPDHIEQCSFCKSLYDSDSSGYYSELKVKFYCDSCFPPFLDKKEEKIMQRRRNRLPDISDDDLNSDEIEFQRCSDCDGHDACEDFGCAIKQGIKIIKPDFE